ncbi:DUF6207 family protein [Streptomyces hydrogenans]|uniref:DUF6207 family protein n=1 Tax=Streptomyces hydrogenans TaxID=1873719 RepID=UPI0036308D64
MESIDPLHLSEPALVVLDITGADEATVQAAVAEVARLWATSGSPKARRIPGEPGVTARMYADLRRPGNSPGMPVGEFLGSLSAGLVIAAATWTVRRVRARRALQAEPPVTGRPPSSRTRTD